MIESEIRAYIIANVASLGARIYPEVIPQSTTLPAVAYNVIGVDRLQTLAGADGLIETTIQYTVVNDTYINTQATVLLLSNLLHSKAVTLTSYKVSHMGITGDNNLGAIDGKNETAKQFAYALDLKIIYRAL